MDSHRIVECSSSKNCQRHRSQQLVSALPAEWTIHLPRLLPPLVNAALTVLPGIATDLEAMGASAPIAHWLAILLRWTRAECRLCNN